MELEKELRVSKKPEPPQMEISSSDKPIAEILTSSTKIHSSKIQATEEIEEE